MSGGAIEARCPQCGATYALSGDLAEYHRDTPFVCRACRFPFDPFMVVPAAPMVEGPVGLAYFDGGEGEERGEHPIRSVRAVQSMVSGMIACALAMVAALMELPPDVRPPVCAAVAVVGVIAAGLGVSAMKGTEESYVDRALTINGIGLGVMGVVAAVILV
jgi:hypothetical protein